MAIKEALLAFLLPSQSLFFGTEESAPKPKASETQKEDSQDLLKHPNLKIEDTTDKACEIALRKMIEIQSGSELLRDVLEHKNCKRLIIKYTKKGISGERKVGDDYYIYLNISKIESIFYHTLTKDGKHKCIGPKFELDQVIFHELYHVFQEIHGLSKLRTWCPEEIDFDNRLEEKAITETNLYRLVRGLPQRVDHRGSTLFCAEQSASKHIISSSNEIDDKTEKLFKKHLFQGLYDALESCAPLSKEQLIAILQSMKPKPTSKIRETFGELLSPSLGTIYSKVNYRYSRRFLDILFLIIDQKGLEIDFNKSEWHNLLSLCLDNIHTFEQFTKLKQMGLEITSSLCSRINHNATEYLQIIEYIISQESSNLKKSLLSAFYVSGK